MDDSQKLCLSFLNRWNAKWVETTAIHEAGHMTVLDLLGYEGRYTYMQNGVPCVQYSNSPTYDGRQDICITIGGDVASCIAMGYPVELTCKALYMHACKRDATADWSIVRNVINDPAQLYKYSALVEEYLRENWSLVSENYRLALIRFDMSKMVWPAVQLMEKGTKKQIHKVFGDVDLRDFKKRFLDPRTHLDAIKSLDGSTFE